MLKFLQGKKTYLTATATILGTLAAVGNGSMTLPEAAQMAVTAILAMTVRAGVTKS